MSHLSFENWPRLSLGLSGGGKVQSTDNQATQWSGPSARDRFGNLSKRSSFLVEILLLTKNVAG